MPDEHELPCVAGNRVQDPGRRIRRLEAPGCRERRKRVAALPVRLGCLPRAQFSAVKDDVRLCAALCRCLGEHVDFDTPAIRERPHRIHIRPYRIAVMNEKQHVLLFDAVYGS